MPLNNERNGVLNSRVVIMITEIFYGVATCISSSSIPKIFTMLELKKKILDCLKYTHTQKCAQMPTDWSMKEITVT